MLAGLGIGAAALAARAAVQAFTAMKTGPQKFYKARSAGSLLTQSRSCTLKFNVLNKFLSIRLFDHGISNLYRESIS